jgi:transposase
MDMSKSYRAAVEDYLPGVDIVFDKFHVIQMVNKAIDKVRKRQCNELDQEGKKALKGSRFLLLYNCENLKKEQQTHLGTILADNQPLLIAYVMKENLRLFWEQKDKSSGRSFLLGWCLAVISISVEFEQCNNKSLRPLKNLAFSLVKHVRGLLNYFDHFISNGKAEGINNKIKTLKRQAYGFRDMEYFKLRLYHLHAQKHRLVG